jgi:hypothetical protein
MRLEPSPATDDNGLNGRRQRDDSMLQERKAGRDLESFDMFVKFVDKLKDYR